MFGEPCNEFANGDQTTTLISTENGKVIQLHHNVMTPRPYSRDYALVGTTGYATKYPIQGFLLGEETVGEVDICVTSFLIAWACPTFTIPVAMVNRPLNIGT